jgi:putative hydrolase of the HAD superfamily
LGIKAVIFDLFGTLIDNFIRIEYQENLHQMARLLQLEPEAFDQAWKDIYQERLLGYCRSPRGCVAKICRQFNVSPPAEAVEQACQLRVDYVRKSVVPRPDTLATLTELRKMGLKIGLLSDCSSEIPEIWPETSLAPFFDTTTFSCNEAAKKPMPKLYFDTAARLNVDVTDCLFVGDGGSLELTGAQRVGMQPIRIQTENERSGRAIQLDPDPWVGTTIFQLRELIPLVASEM